MGVTSATAVEAYSRREIQLTLLFACLGTVFDGVELNLLSYPLVYISQTLNVAIVQHRGRHHGTGSRFTPGRLCLWVAGGCDWPTPRVRALHLRLRARDHALAAFAPNYPFFLGSRILAGLGIGGELGLAFAMFSECWHTERRGLMGGTIQTMFIVGQIITQGVLYSTLTMFGYDTGWRAGFLVLGIVSILLAFATLTWTPESHKWLRYQAEFERGTLPEELQRTSVPYADLFRGSLAGGTIAFMVIMTAIFMYSYSLGTFWPHLPPECR